jgi:hypothetical protein
MLEMAHISYIISGRVGLADGYGETRERLFTVAVAMAMICSMIAIGCL